MTDDFFYGPETFPFHSDCYTWPRPRREDPELIEARRNLAEPNIHHYIQRVLASAPPLSDEQVLRLRDLLRPNTSQFARDALDDRDRHTNVSQADRDLLDDFGLPETHDRAGAGTEQAPIRPGEADADDRVAVPMQGYKSP